MIDTLTKEQESQLKVYADKWINRFLSGKAYPNIARKQIKWLYSFCKLKEPIIFLVDSPMACQLAANYFNNVWDNVRANVMANVGANVWDNVMANVRANVMANVGANVWDNVMANVVANVGANVRANVWDNVMANVVANVGANVRANVGANVRANVVEKLRYYDFCSFGNYSDYSWLSFYDYMDSVLNIDLKNKAFFEFKKLIISGVFDMIQLDGLCIASSLPIVVKRNQNGVLHSEKGAAIVFRDGYAQWYWKGICVPPHWIDNSSSITKEEVIAQSKNIEKRRVLIDILGVKSYFAILGNNALSLIDEDIDNKGNNMRLYSFMFENKKIKVLECVCPSTKRIYNIYPPNQDSDNVFIAKASTFGITEKECRELINES